MKSERAAGMIDNKLGITDGAALYLTLGGGPVVLGKRESDSVLLCTSKSFYAILKQVAENV